MDSSEIPLDPEFANGALLGGVDIFHNLLLYTIFLIRVLRGGSIIRLLDSIWRVH